MTEPTREVSRIRFGAQEWISTEKRCSVCNGFGAVQLPSPFVDGEIIPQRVKDVEKFVHRNWMHRHGYDDENIAPCYGCDGVGWIHMEWRRADG